MTASEELLANEIDPEFQKIWDQQMLEYPTISRNEAGEWNYFDVTPDQPEVVWEGGRRVYLDAQARLRCSERRARSWRSRRLRSPVGTARRTVAL
jgi:hypothetical protein